MKAVSTRHELEMLYYSDAEVLAFPSKSADRTHYNKPSHTSVRRDFGLAKRKCEPTDHKLEMAWPKMSDSADSILIEAAMDGDRPAFAELIERYRSVVLGTVRRTLGNTAETEDALQEIFMRALVALPKYDRRYPFAPWILKIASNYCIDQLRRKKTRKYRLFSDLSEAEENKILSNMSTRPETEEMAPEDKAKYLEVAQSLLNRLKPRRRMAFVLREIEGRSYEEVSAILGIPEVTVRVRVWRARADLHQDFRDHLLELEKGVRNEKTL